jgi:hypothetical protein
MGMEKRSKYSCADYRQEMMLLALRRRLAQDNLSEEERRRIDKEMQRLELAMKMTEECDT